MFLSFIQAKDDMDINSDSSSSDEGTATGAYWDSSAGLPFTDRVSEEELLSIYDALIEHCRYTAW